MERIKSKNIVLVYDNKTRILDEGIIRQHLASISSDKKNKITIKNIDIINDCIQVGFMFERKSNYALSLFNITCDNHTIEPLKKSFEKSSKSVVNKNDKINLIFEYVIKDIVVMLKNKDMTVGARGRYLLLEYSLKPDVGLFLDCEDILKWYEPRSNGVWYILLKYNTRVQKRTMCSYKHEDNVLIGKAVINNSEYELLKTIIRKVYNG